MTQRSLAVDVPRPYKREAGVTRVFATPLHVRVSGVSVDPELEARVPELLGRKLERYADNVTRVALRFIDVNGPRGGIDTVCRIEMSVTHRDHLVVEARARDAAEAFRKASALARTALARTLEKRPRGKRRPFAARAQPPQPPSPPARKRAGTAARNVRSRARGAIVALEDSATGRPSRKLTRKSAQRQKAATQLTRRTKRARHTPKARAARR